MGQARGPARATGDTIARSTGLAAVSQLSVAAFTAFLTLYLVRVLGPSEYGIFAVALSVGALALLPSDLGISLSAARFIAERREEPTAAADILRDALRLKVVVGLVVSVALIVVAEPIAWIYGEPGLVWPIRAVSVAVFGQGLVLFFQRAFIALGRVAVGLRIVVSESAFEVGATVTLVMLGMGAGGAAFGRATGYLLGTLVAVVLTVRALGRRAVAGPGHVREAMRSIAGYAGALLVIEAAYTLFSQIDVLLVGALLGPAAAGVFQAPVRLATFLGYPGLAIANGVAPRLARGEAQQPNVGAFELGMRLLIVFQALALAPLLVWAEPLVDLLLGSEYAESASVLRALTPYIFLSGIAPLLALGVNFLGEARRRIPLAFAAVTVNTVVCLVLIPEIGVVGGAIGSSLGYLLYVPAHLVVIRRTLDLSLRPLGATLVRSLLAAAVMAGVLAALGTGEVSLPLLAAGAFVGTAAFTLTLYATGELRRRDVDAVRTVLARRRAARSADTGS